jgi:hypothetical protein
MTGETMQVQAEGWNHHIGRQIERRWAPVCRAWFPEGATESINWTWTFFQYVFPLADPRGFPPVQTARWSSSERHALSRYVSHARDLAGTTLLTARNGYSVHIATPDSEPEITETASSRDLTIGFLTMLRQCYSPDEDASFKRAYDLVSREVHAAGSELAVIKAWRRVHAALRTTHLDHMILVKAAADGLVPQAIGARNAHSPGEINPPQAMIGAMFYGDAIHWGDRRSVIEAWDSEHAVIATRLKFDALRAAVHLGHFYVGFAAIVGMATGGLGRDDL